MELRNYYVIKDELAGLYGDLMFCVNDEVAIRNFKQILVKYPFTASDMNLYRVGVFDIKKGLFISSCPSPILVVKGVDVLEDVNKKFDLSNLKTSDINEKEE